jgi:hypothetical protein
MPRGLSSSRLPVILTLTAGFALSSLACASIPFLAPTTTPTATRTPTSTFTPTSTPTPTATRTPTRTITPTVSYRDWPVVFSDSFDDNDNGWPIGDYEDEYEKGILSITDGKYLIDITAKKPFFWWLPPDMENMKDFYLSVEGNKLEGPADMNYGLVFRDFEGLHYYFQIRPDTQHYKVSRFDGQEWLTLIDSTFSSRIERHGSNQLAVLAQGSHFTFFINGKEVDTAEDDTLKTGRCGVGFSVYHAGDKLKLEFDHFEVRVPKKNR